MRAVRVLAIALLGLPLLAAAVAAAGFTPEVGDALRSSKQIYVATRRANGSQSDVVPVWFMVDGDTVLFTTGPESHKVRRIKRGSPVLVWVGSREGPHFEGDAEVLQDPELAARMAPVYAQKYWIAWIGLFKPNPDRVRAGKTSIVRVRPR
jgi:PPOX class probable F420-dependent enzyme